MEWGVIGAVTQIVCVFALAAAVFEASEALGVSLEYDITFYCQVLFLFYMQVLLQDSWSTLNRASLINWHILCRRFCIMCNIIIC